MDSIPLYALFILCSTRSTVLIRLPFRRVAPAPAVSETTCHACHNKSQQLIIRSFSLLRLRLCSAWIASRACAFTEHWGQAHCAYPKIAARPLDSRVTALWATRARALAIMSSEHCTVTVLLSTSWSAWSSSWLEQVNSRRLTCVAWAAKSVTSQVSRHSREWPDISSSFCKPAPLENYEY